MICVRVRKEFPDLRQNEKTTKFVRAENTIRTVGQLKGEPNTFAGCVLSHVQLFATPWTVACQAPLSMGILQAKILEWVAMPSSRGSSQPRDRTQVSHIAGWFFPIWVTREALEVNFWLLDQFYSIKTEKIPTRMVALSDWLGCY